jgi:diaminopimelate epimerase
LRHDPSLAQGANVNFVAPAPDGGWRIRTYERGVEGETLACGTGAVATAILLRERGETDGEVALATKSERVLRVRLEEHTLSGWHPTLSGEARLVYQGTLGER